MEIQDRKYFFVKISCPKETDGFKFGNILRNLINQVIFNSKLENIPYRLDEANPGDIFFLQIGGDNSHKSRYFNENPELQNFINGIYGIGEIIETTPENKSVNAKFYGFDEPVTKKQLYYFPQFIDNLGASTKGIPNQAGLYLINNNEAKSFIDFLKSEEITGVSSQILNPINTNGYLNQIAKQILSKDEELISKTTEEFLSSLEKRFVTQSSFPVPQTNFTIHEFNKALKNSGLLFDQTLISRFLISVLSKPFTILTGLAGSGKSQIAISLAKWITGGRSRYIILSKALKDDNIKRNYDIVNHTENIIELINRSGTSGKIIPLPVNLIFEWFDEIIQGNLTENDDPKNFKDIIDKKSGYQKYMQGFYNDLSKIAFTMVKYANKMLTIDNYQYNIVPVGADWTNREPLFGYPNALKPKDYVLPESGVLQLILKAKIDPNKPYFLILDEMNLSHVERYFADFLSAIESNEEIKLHSGDRFWEVGEYRVPPTIKIPKNLFVIGTVNIDETTYMFSPKVLDRANVIEFRVNHDELKQFLDNPVNVDIELLRGQGDSMAGDFVDMAKSDAPIYSQKQKLSDELLEFFKELNAVGAEFGYRSAYEISRFAAISEQLAKDWEFNNIMDAAVAQKLLPKLHGSRRKLEKVLFKLGDLCYSGTAGECENLFKKPESIDFDKARYPISFEKIVRMHKGLIDNGFTSFAEA